MQESFYPEKIMGYLLSLPNSGAIAEENIDNKYVFKGEAGSLEKGIVIKLFIIIDSDNNLIEQVRYLVYGDGYIISALGKLSTDLTGLKIKQAMNYSMANLSKDLEIPPNKANKLKIIKNCLDEILNKIK